MFRFLHAADVHLDSPLVNLRQQEGIDVAAIRSAPREALKKLVKVAIDRRVQLVLIAGDLYDGDWKDSHTGLFFCNQLALLQKAGIHVLVITGNHDAASVMTRSLPLPKNPDGTSVMLANDQPETRRLEQFRVAIHGQGFSKPQVERNVVPDYPPPVSGWFNIGMLHTSLDYETESNHARYAPCKLSDLIHKGYDYWALGHIHQRSVRHERPTIVYPGNIQGRHAKETGDKGCYIVTVNDAGEDSLEFCSLESIRWEHVTVDAVDCETRDDVLARFAEVAREVSQQVLHVPIAMRVTIRGACDAHDQLHENAMELRDHLLATAFGPSDGRAWVEKIRLETTPATAVTDWDDDGPLSVLMSELAALEQDERLDESLRAFGDLRRDLPSDMLQGDDAPALTSKDGLRRVIDDARGILKSRLLQQRRSNA